MGSIIFDELRAEYDDEYRKSLEECGYIRVPISLHHLFKFDWIHETELDQMRSDFKDFFLINEKSNEAGYCDVR